MTSSAPLTVGSLCSGIGGIDLGLERAGMKVVWQSEVDPYASRVLAKHWPHVPNLGDLKTIDWSTVERPDLICGGYPCQPFSFAGRREGVDDPRHLWPWVAECLRLVRPRWALFENVPGHLSLGFDTVLADLAALGFDVEWELLPAAAFGAPHLRYRLFIVAHAPAVYGGAFERDEPDRVLPAHVADSRRLRGEPRRDAGVVGRPPRAREGEAPERQRLRDAVGDSRPDLADTDGGRFKVGSQLDSEPSFRAADRSASRGHADRRGDEVADPAGLGLKTGVFASRDRAWGPECARWWESEPDVGRVADGVPSRVDRLRGLGNAVVPQVAEWVGRQIIEAAA